MTTFATVRALESWVWDHTDPYATLDDVGRIVEAIRNDHCRPAWGEDWSGYLGRLPECLYELIR